MDAVASKAVKRSAQERRARVEELQGRISEAVASFVDTRNWEAWLTFIASFHTYSWRNQILIMRQCPYAMQVAGFNTWRKHGRVVRKGEKGIRIFGGRRIREEDDSTGEERERVVFFPVSVFDISQTDVIEGEKEILPPTFALEGDDEAHLFEPLATYLQNEGWNVERKPLPIAVNGLTCHTTRTVTVSNAVDDAQAAKTLIHEAAHVLMHADISASQYHAERGIWETEAESVAYVVAAYFGADTSHYSIPYIKDWSRGDSDLIQATAERVSKTAHILIDELAKLMSEEAQAA